MILTAGQIITINKLTVGLPTSAVVHLDPLVKGGVDNGALVVTLPGDLATGSAYTVQKSGRIL